MIDPVCLFHGLKRSEHYCLYCCLCFKALTPEECYVDEDGIKHDVCVPCAEAEALVVLGYCSHGVNLDHDFCEKGCRV